jgi:hypothetical protein
MTTTWENTHGKNTQTFDLYLGGDRAFYSVRGVTDWEFSRWIYVADTASFPGSILGAGNTFHQALANPIVIHGISW